MNLFLQRHLLLFIWNFHGQKTKGRVGQRPNSFQYFLPKPSRLYSNFCFNYFHFGSEKEYCVKGLFNFVRIQWGIQARQMENSGMAEKLVIRKVFWIKFGSSQDISSFCWWLKNICVLEGNGQNKNGKMWEKIPTLRETPPPPCGNTHVKKFKVYFVF